VAAFQLNIDLREGIFEAVPQDDEGVVLADDEHQRQNRDGGEDNKKDNQGTHGAGLSPPAWWRATPKTEARPESG